VHACAEATGAAAGRRRHWGERQVLDPFATATNPHVSQRHTCKRSPRDQPHPSEPYVGGASFEVINLVRNGALSGLTHLGHLRLEGNSISDVSALSGLTGLSNWLDLSDNAISDIGPLSTLTNLEALWLSENTITDISALSGLTSLNTVGLASNADLRDVHPLVVNSGIDAGDFVDLSNVSPALSCADVATLESRGVTVVSSCP
jgi:internalin A